MRKYKYYLNVEKNAAFTEEPCQFRIKNNVSSKIEILKYTPPIP